MVPSGSAVWLALGILAASGFGGASLGHWRLGRAAAAAAALGIGVASFASPDAVNLGACAAAAVGVVLLAARSARPDLPRGVTAALLAGGALFVLLPSPWSAPVAEPPLVAGLAVGALARVVGGPGRGGLAAALLSAPLDGVAAWSTARLTGLPGQVPIGGGGAFGAEAAALALFVLTAEAAARWSPRQTGDRASGETVGPPAGSPGSAAAPAGVPERPARPEPPAGAPPPRGRA